MSVTINGSGTIGGLSVGGLPDGTVDGDTLASSIDLTGKTLTDPQISGGIYLGGTGSANYFDDYEEGTFTPTFVSSGGGTPTYTTQTGRYTKIGRLVYACMRVTLSNKTGLSAGDVYVGGLPFTSNSTNAGRLGTTEATLNNITSYGLGDSGGNYLGPNDTRIILGDNAQNSVTVSDLQNTSQVDIQITYET